MPHSLASIKPKYVDLLLNGIKTVELRRRRIHLPPGCILWVYSTLPKGRIVAAASVARVYHGTPNMVWSRFKDRAGISRTEYNAYTKNAALVTAIDLARIVPLQRPVPLSEMRLHNRSFHPPQSIVFIQGDDPVLAVLRTLLPDELRVPA
jgi:predicted transcriptional regulator